MKHKKKIVGGALSLLAFLVVFTACEPEPEPKVAPENFRVEANEKNGTLKLEWDTNYQCDIWRATSEEELKAFDTDDQLDVEASRKAYRAFSDRDVVPGTTYYYKVRKMGEEDWPFSEVVSIECPEFTPKIREFNVEQNGSKADISWEIAFWDGGGDTPRINIKKVKRGDETNPIYYTSYSGNEYLASYTGGGEKSYTTLSGALQPDSTYDFTFFIYPENTFDAYDTAEDTISIAHNYELVPTEVTASRDGNYITVDWTNAPDAEYYRIKIDLSDGYSEVNFSDGQPTAGPVTVDLDSVPSDGDELTILVIGEMQDNDYTGIGETTLTW